MDNVSRATRSRIMASVPQRNTKPELTLRTALHHLGIRYRLHDVRLPGRPDLVLKKFGAVIFVHGCFWHGHICRYATSPATHTEFWRGKLAANKARDKLVLLRLSETGWRALVVWECAMKASGLTETVQTVADWLRSGECSGEIDQAGFHAVAAPDGIPEASAHAVPQSLARRNESRRSTRAIK